MALTGITLAARSCTAAEAQALSLWSASFLPLCRTWAAKRGLQPPPDVTAALQQARFAAPSLTSAKLQPLVTAPPDSEQRLFADDAGALPALMTDLARDLDHFFALLSRAAPSDAAQGIAATSRDLARFQRTLAQLQRARVAIVVSEPLLVTLFSRQSGTLYLPHWLLAALPAVMFAPNRAFYRPRRASLAWLLLDAIVIIAANEFKWYDAVPGASTR